MHVTPSIKAARYKNCPSLTVPFVSRYFRVFFICSIFLSLAFLSLLYSPDNLIGRIITFRQKPIILVWTPFFRKKNWVQNVSCHYDCYITSNRTFINESSAVVFHLRDVDIHDLPPIKASQKWVLFNKEPPPHTPIQLIEALEGKIHWTVTYRPDSEIFSPYGMVVPTKGMPIVKGSNDIPNKSKEVCWIVSHCSTLSQRELYVKALSHHVNISIYGSCGTNVCPNSNGRQCYKHISQDCKYYLSFENSICSDYATEKVFYALETDMVPIVMGGATYSQILPDHSYINALDFLNPKDLAVYLLELDNNPERFNAYHAWKANYQVVDISHRWLCDLCQKLHSYETIFPTKVYKNLSSWWFSPKCSAWTDMLEFL